MTRAHMQIREDSRRLGNQYHAKEAAGWAEVGPGRPAGLAHFEAQSAPPLT
jgi:hypothetical protein